MLHLLLIPLLWLQTEAAAVSYGCLLLPLNSTLHCANISTAEVAASFLTTPTDPASSHFVRLLEVEDCLDEQEGVVFDFPAHLESARFHRCPPPHIRTASLTELDLSECGLNEVPHLSHLVGLRRLRLRDNRISHLPTTASWWPPSLVELDLTNNKIDRLKGSSLPSTLVSFSLASNRLSSASSLLDHPRLERLDLRDNLITTLPRPRLPPAIKWMDMRGNPLRCECWFADSPALIHPPCNLEHCRPEGREEKEEVRLVALSSSTVQVKGGGGRGGTLVYRQEDDPSLKMTLVSSAPFIHSLRPSTAYIVCVARHSSSAYTVDPAHCRRVVTLPPPTPRLLDLSVAPTSVRLRWKGNASEWRIRVSGPASSTAHMFSSAYRLHEYAVTGLEPRTDYDVCVEDAATEAGSSCVTVHTEGEEQHEMSTAVGVSLGLVALGLVGLAIVALCRHRWKNTPITAEDTEEEGGISKSGFDEEEEQQSRLGPIPVEREDEFASFREGGFKNYARSWSTLRLPHSVTPPAPIFCSFRRPCGYRDHLTSVTIYSSGHSEC